jgi:hypothetical protein
MGWVETFKRTFLRDDLDGFMELIGPDCEWTIMATAERFTAAARIRELAQRSMAARRHVCLATASGQPGQKLYS